MKTWQVWRIMVGRGLVDNLGTLRAVDDEAALREARRRFDPPPGERLEVEEADEEEAP
jgi:hypothetical protein